MSKPLTIDELKALKVGDWVWIVRKTNKGKHGAYYQILDIDDYDDSCSFRSNGYLFPTSLDDYGETWFAYKNKEAAEAKGELVELPCKFGDTVYYIATHYDKSGLVYDEVRETKFNYSAMADLGGLHFLTRAEAELRLAELKGE